MKQLDLPAKRVDCPSYEVCAAPLCPMDIDLGSRVWFPNEPVCRLRKCPGWVRKQRKIAKLPGIKQDRYFTIRMLNSIKQIRKGLQGASPSSPDAEKFWLRNRQKIKPANKAKKLERAQLRLEL
ncbi:MAG: hypothetical protein J7L19_03435 [Dehalococcoidia bacterium]|nr:hypothetical protein [Dehalococcoidia bacterium]